MHRVASGAVIARAGYTALLGLATLSPFTFDPDPASLPDRLTRAFTIQYEPRDVVDAARNLALFMGWGALWIVTSASRTGRSPLVAPLLTGFALGAGAETLQLAIPERTTSILDVLTNTIGSGLGAVLVIVMVQIAVHLRGRQSYVGIPAVTFFGAYLGAVLFEATFPLGLETVAGAAGGPLRRARASLAEFSIASVGAISFTDLLLFLPLGAFAVAMLREFGMPLPKAARRTAALAGGVFILTELAHAPLGLPMRIGAILTHWAAVALSALAAGRWLPAFSQRLHGPARPAALFTAYAALLMVWIWRPFLPVVSLAAIAGELTLNRLIPLSALGDRVELHSVADIGESFFLFLPVGAILAVWPLRRRGALSAGLPGLYLAAALECVQLVLPERFFDVTDVLVQAAAVGIGWTIIRRAGYGVYGQLVSPAPASARPRAGPP